MPCNKVSDNPEKWVCSDGDIAISLEGQREDQTGDDFRVSYEGGNYYVENTGRPVPTL